MRWKDGEKKKNVRGRGEREGVSRGGERGRGVKRGRAGGDTRVLL